MSGAGRSGRGAQLLQAGVVIAVIAAFATGGLASRYLAGGVAPLFALVAAATAIFLLRGRPAALTRSPLAIAAEGVIALALMWAVLSLLPGPGDDWRAGAAFWFYAIAAWLFAWATVTRASVLAVSGWLKSVFGITIPALFGVTVVFLWEAITRGAGIPFVLLPPPSAIGTRIIASVPLLAQDFGQTVLKSVLAGFLLGSGAGFLVAVLADRYKFLANGLLPLGNLVSALPIIGIAPIMVIWFGFDWFSKAAVVMVMTFFPMLVNTLIGLKASGAMERDLMRTYHASHWKTLFALRLPAAMPFIFNALKINSTLALIGAIVAEFFGTPVVGMGFRISTEVGRMNLDMVWAEIAMAALTGSVFYGILALIERGITFWHPSYRQ